MSIDRVPTVRASQPLIHHHRPNPNPRDATRRWMHERARCVSVPLAYTLARARDDDARLTTRPTTVTTTQQGQDGVLETRRRPRGAYAPASPAMPTLERVARPDDERATPRGAID